MTHLKWSHIVSSLDNPSNNRPIRALSLMGDNKILLLHADSGKIFMIC